eukprot:jgi/Bigna1/71192/fgenesh1_pg.14_\
MRVLVGVITLALAVAGKVMKPAKIVHNLMPIEIEAQMDHWLVRRDSPSFPSDSAMLETQASMGEEPALTAALAYPPPAAQTEAYLPEPALPSTFYGTPYGPPYLSAPEAEPALPEVPPPPWVSVPDSGNGDLGNSAKSMTP